MSRLYEKLIRPLAFGIDPERAHEVGIEALRFGLGTEAARSAASARYAVDGFGSIERFGLRFPNPLGVAAGFDKNGIVVEQLGALGFGFVEVGTVTLEPQKGNEKPRLFRLPDDGALINRLGFNNDGAHAVADRLRKLKRSEVVTGVNIGKNKDVPNDKATANYLGCLEIFHDVADYIAVNVSSPNTPSLRDLQQGESFEQLVGALVERNKVLSSNTKDAKPLLIKIAPDLSEGDLERMVDVCLRLGVAGVIATNTTVTRFGLRSKGVEAIGAGGMSGRPLAPRSTEVIRSIYRYANGRLPIIGVGGIFTAEDAFDKITAGASLVQAYTGFVYGGPSFAHTVNKGLLRLLREKGFERLDDAVGSEA